MISSLLQRVVLGPVDGTAFRTDQGRHVLTKAIFCREKDTLHSRSMHDAHSVAKLNTAQPLASDYLFNFPVLLVCHSVSLPRVAPAV